MSDKCDDYYHNPYRILFNIFIQLATWFIIIWCAVMGSYRGNLHWAEITSLVLVYLGYVIYFFCYRSFSYLRHNFNKKTILEDDMKNLFYTPPQLEFHVECYHYETRTSYSRSGGTRTRRVKVVTHKESEIFKYYTWRDVSGAFTLKISEANKNHKPFIQLDLILDIDFAEDISRCDYDKQKKSQYDRNRNLDTYISQWEVKKLNGFESYNLVRISDNGGYLIGFYWYIFFTIIFFVLIYDWYFNYMCIRQDFSIKKIVSTRYDLNSPENNDKYATTLPKIIKKDSEILYDVAPLPLHNSPTIPNEFELKQAYTFVRGLSGKVSGENDNNDNIIRYDDYVINNNNQIEMKRVNMNDFCPIIEPNIEVLRPSDKNHAILSVQDNQQIPENLNRDYPAYDEIKDDKVIVNEFYHSDQRLV
jgi:hypothetical protein